MKKRGTSCGVSRKRIRDQHAQALVESVIGLILIVIATTFGTLILFEVGTGLFFQGKLEFITQQAANFAVLDYQSGSLESDTTSFVQTLMPRVGMPSYASLSVNVSSTSINGTPAEQVRVSVNIPFGNLIGTPSLLPLGATAVAVRS